jgi:hypothetical protein
LNQKFAKQFLFFAGSPNLILARFLWQPHLTPLPFSKIGPPAIRPKRPDPLLSWPFGPTRPTPSSPSLGLATANLRSLPCRAEPAATSELSRRFRFLSQPCPHRFPFTQCRIDAQKIIAPLKPTKPPATIALPLCSLPGPIKGAVGTLINPRLCSAL